MTIGQRIEARRKELGMSQEELAHKLGYKERSTIAKIESGANSLRQSKIVAIAQALDTTIAYVMGWDEKTAPTISAKKQRLIDAVADMSDSDVDMLLGLISRIKKGD